MRTITHDDGLIWTYVTTIDVIKFRSADEYVDWTEKYHPRRYAKFGAWSTKKLSESAFELWLPILKGSNKSNKKSNICAAEKDIDSWLKVYNHLTS